MLRLDFFLLLCYIAVDLIKTNYTYKNDCVIYYKTMDARRKKKYERERERVVHEKRG